MRRLTRRLARKPGPGVIGTAWQNEPMEREACQREGIDVGKGIVNVAEACVMSVVVMMPVVMVVVMMVRLLVPVVRPVTTGFGFSLALVQTSAAITTAINTFRAPTLLPVHPSF